MQGIAESTTELAQFIQSKCLELRWISPFFSSGFFLRSYMPNHCTHFRDRIFALENDPLRVFFRKNLCHRRIHRSQIPAQMHLTVDLFFSQVHKQRGIRKNITVKPYAAALLDDLRNFFILFRPVIQRIERQMHWLLVFLHHIGQNFQFTERSNLYVIV